MEPAVPHSELRLHDRTEPGAPYFARYATIDTAEGSRATGFFSVDYYNVIAIMAGEVGCVLPDGRGRMKQVVMRAGDMYMWRPQDKYGIRPMGECSFVDVGFPPGDWRTFATMTGIEWTAVTAPETPHARFDPSDPAATRPFEQVCAALDRGATMVDLVKFWVEIMPILVPSRSRPERGFGAPAWFLRSMDAMREEENLRMGVSRFLELAHVSSRQLARTSQKYFEMTPTDLVADLRIRHAARLLSTTSESIGSISDRCGFSSPAYFSNRFRLAMAASPRAYRQRFLGEYLGASR